MTGTRAEKLDAAGAHMHCTCPRDDEGERERAFIERTENGRTYRDWYHLTNPTCPLHSETAERSPF